MKPCNCKTLQDCEKLKVRAIDFNDGTIRVDLFDADEYGGPASTGVMLSIDPHLTDIREIRCKFSHQTFSEFVKWYLEYQDEL